jgi:hypothetical protein
VQQSESPRPSHAHHQPDALAIRAGPPIMQPVLPAGDLPFRLVVGHHGRQAIERQFRRRAAQDKPFDTSYYNAGVHRALIAPSFSTRRWTEPVGQGRQAPSRWNPADQLHHCATVPAPPPVARLRSSLNRMTRFPCSSSR